jgi:hypothetical protein
VVNFKLSPLPAYFIPEPGSLGSFKDYIATLPATDRCAAHNAVPTAASTHLPAPRCSRCWCLRQCRQVTCVTVLCLLTPRSLLCSG